MTFPLPFESGTYSIVSRPHNIVQPPYYINLLPVSARPKWEDGPAKLHRSTKLQEMS